MRSAVSPSRNKLLVALAGLLALYLAAPLFAGAAALAHADWPPDNSPALLRASVVSVASASMATLLAAIGGIPLGYVLAHTRGRGAAMLGFMVQLPLALPPLASGILLLFLFGPYTPLGRISPVTDTFAGVVLAQLFVASPFVVIAARSAFAALDPTLLDVAASMGHGPASRFRRVALPLAWPGLCAGLVLAWLRGFGEFGATVMLAYHPASLPVYTYVAFGATGLPAMLPVLLPMVCGAVIAMGINAWLARATPRLRRARLFAGPVPAQASGTIRFQVRKDLPGFTLDIGWQPESRHLAILGPSGSGKSMTLRLLAGLDATGVASLSIGDRAISGPAETRSIGYMPQTLGLFPDRNLWAQLLFPVGAKPDQARHWIARLGLTGLENRRPDQLSMGQQQRVALARCLLRPAGLLLLDEPFSAVDAPLRHQLQGDILQLQRDNNLATLLVTHDADEALRLAEEWLVIEDGRVLQTGLAQHVYRRPASARVARLLGARPLAGTMRQGLIVLDDAVCLSVGTPALPDGAVGWAVRPGLVHIGADGTHPGWIEDVHGCDATVRLGNVCLSALVPPGTAIGPCRITIPAAAIQVWPTTPEAP